MSPTPQQRDVALAKANHARFEHARIRAEIHDAGRDGARIAAEHVRAADTSMTFERLILAVPRVGETILRRMLGNARIAGIAHVDDKLLAPSKRDILVGELIAHAYAGEHRKRRGEP